MLCIFCPIDVNFKPVRTKLTINSENFYVISSEIFPKYYFAQWILYLHINIIPFHNTTKVFIHSEYSVKSMIVYISNYHLKGNKFLLSWFYITEKLNSQLTYFKPRNTLPYLQVLLTKQTMLYKDQVCFQFWEQPLCTKKQNNYNAFITLEKTLSRWNWTLGCFLTFTWYLVYSVFIQSYYHPGWQCNLSQTNCSLALWFKDPHLHSTVVHFLHLVINLLHLWYLKLLSGYYWLTTNYFSWDLILSHSWLTFRALVFNFQFSRGLPTSYRLHGLPSRTHMIHHFNYCTAKPLTILLFNFILAILS